MADVIVGLTGRPFYKINDELAEILAEAGIVNYLKRHRVAQANLAPEPERWVLVRGGPHGDKLLLVYHDGRGGKQLYDAPPKSRLVRKWVFDPNKDEDGHYEMVEAMPAIPAAVLAEWRAAGGEPVDPDVGPELYRQMLNDVDAKLANQNSLGNTFLRVQGARK